MRLATLTALLLLPLAAVAQVYSWKDASGKVHYSDRPPVDQPGAARRVGTGLSAPEGADASRKALAEKGMEAKQGRQKATEAATKAEKDKADSAEKQANCERARTNLQAVESGQVRFRIGADGEREALDGDVRDAEIAQARKAVDSWCK